MQLVGCAWRRWLWQPWPLPHRKRLWPALSTAQAPTPFFKYPFGVAIIGDNAFICDSANNVIRSVTYLTVPGVVTTVAGGGGSHGTAAGAIDGVGTNAMFYGSRGVAAASSLSLVFIADTSNQKIRAMDITTFVVTSIAGGGTGGTSATTGISNGVGTNAHFLSPFGLAFDGGSILYVADSGNNQVRAIALANPATGPGTVTQLAGGGLGNSNGGDDGFGTNALFNQPYNLVVTGGSGTAAILFVTDSNNVRRVTSAGTVTTYAGAFAGISATCSYADGTGTNARFKAVSGITYSSSTNSLYLLDTTNKLVRSIGLADAGVMTIAGSVSTESYIDGSGTNALFRNAFGIAVYPAPPLLGPAFVIADTFNMVVRMMYM